MKTVKLGDLNIEWKRGSGLRKSDVVEDGPNKCVLYGELFTKYKTVDIGPDQLSKTNSSSGTVSQAGDILVPGTSTAAKSEMIRARVLNEEGVLIGGDINVIRAPQDLFYPKYLAYFFDTKSAKKQLLPYVTGTTGIIHISNTGLKNLEIPLVSIEEQKKIVEGLDATFERISAAEILTRQNLDNVAALQKSILHKYLSASDSTHIHRLADLVKICHGKDWKGLASGPVPVYGSGGFMGKYVDTVAYDKPTVLLPRKGTITNIFYLEEPFWNVDTVFYTKIDTDKLVPRYFYYFMQTVDLQALDSGSGRPSLTQSALYEITMPVPPIDEQAEIVAKLNDTFDKSREIESQYQKKLAKLTDLRQSLLAEAFSTTNTV